MNHQTGASKSGLRKKCKEEVNKQGIKQDKSVRTRTTRQVFIVPESAVKKI